MSDPHAVLGVSVDADEAAVRRRYLELVRAFPPDRAPERFAAIRAAYDQLRDPAGRLETELLRADARDSIEALIQDLRARLRHAHAPVRELLKLGEAL